LCKQSSDHALKDIYLLSFLVGYLPKSAHSAVNHMCFPSNSNWSF